MRVLALMGLPRTGKNTLAEHLRTALPGKVEVVELTTPAKNFLASITGVSADSLKDQPLGGGTSTPRELIIKLMNVVDRQLGLEWFEPYLESFRGKCDWLVIPGIRTAAQMTWTKRNGFVCFLSRLSYPFDEDGLSSVDRGVTALAQDADMRLYIHENPDWSEVAEKLVCSLRSDLRPPLPPEVLVAAYQDSIHAKETVFRRPRLKMKEDG